MTEYQKAHRPASEFETREAYLEHELKIINTKRWGLSLPGRDYRFEIEDIVPAIAGTIGAAVLIPAMIAAYATAYGLPPEFALENARFEILIAVLLFAVPICGFINPRCNLPGAHGPLLPLIGTIVLAGGHPLALGLLMCVFGVILALTKGGSRLVNLTGPGVRGGLLITLGMMGLLSQLAAFRTWATGIGNEFVFFLVILVTILTYVGLARIGKRWLAIPLCALVALVVALVMGTRPEFATSPGIPNMNPFYWWGADTGWQLGLPNMGHFIAVLPFAVLAIAMWPPDFLGHRVFQEVNYPKGTDNALMNVDDTMLVCSVRQAVGSTLGGGSVASSWGTYLIPAAIAKRPIPAGALLTALGCTIAVIAGYPMDLAKWDPVLRVALIVGVFLPLVEAGFSIIKSRTDAEGAGLCILVSLLVNPVFGWAVAMFADNVGLICPKRARSLPLVDRLVTPLITLVVLTAILTVVGLIPGIPAIM